MGAYLVVWNLYEYHTVCCDLWPEHAKSVILLQFWVEHLQLARGVGTGKEIYYINP